MAVPHAVTSLRTEIGAVEERERGETLNTNPLLNIGFARPTSAAAELSLRQRGVVVTEDTRALTGTEKLSLLRNIDRHFDATPQEQALHCDFYDSVRATWRLINPLSPENVARYRSFGDAIRNGNPQLMPVAATQGAGYVICSVGASGGLRFVERTTHVLGSSMRIRPAGDDFIPYWPAMVVHWPACGSIDQFHANFVSVFDGNAHNSQYFRTVFRASAKRATRPIYVTALAAIANVGVLFVVGATSSNFHRENSRKICDFLEEFMRRTGISVVFVCTPPVYEKLMYLSACASLTSGGVEEIKWLDTTSKFFRALNLNLLNQSLVWDAYDEVPGRLLEAAAMCTHGSRDALNVFYRQLHIAAVRAKDKPHPEKLLDGVIKTTLKHTEQLQKVGAFLESFCAGVKANAGAVAQAKLPNGRIWEDFLSLDTLQLMGF